LDNQIVDSVRNFLFGPPGAGGLDLASLNIQRGRDHGLADYNSTRAAYGLKKVTSFDQITSDPVLAGKLKDLYGSVDNVDLWVGGWRKTMSEAGAWPDLPADPDQLTRRATAALLVREHLQGQGSPCLENDPGDVIERNTGVDNLQDDVFFFE
jgi:hypothetical protein